jgi:hypothetical protein
MKKLLFKLLPKRFKPRHHDPLLCLHLLEFNRSSIRRFATSAYR